VPDPSVSSSTKADQSSVRARLWCIRRTVCMRIVCMNTV
jgi:hypothetical protein